MGVFTHPVAELHVSVVHALWSSHGGFGVHSQTPAFASHTSPGAQSVSETQGAQLLMETLLVSIVTAPFRAKALPDTSAPVFRVMLVSARMFPTNAVPVPRVAELPTCQNTLHA